MTDPRIEPLLQGLRDTRRRTLERVASLSQKELDAAPEPRAWSVGEILDHLLNTDDVYQADLEELFRRLDEGRDPEVDRSLSEFDIGFRWIPRPLTPLLMVPLALFNFLAPPALRELLARTPIVPVRNAHRTTPRPGRPGKALRTELAASVGETAALFAGRDDLPVDRMRMSYPLIGTKTLPELLAFAADHELRHQRQIDATLRRIGARF